MEGTEPQTNTSFEGSFKVSPTDLASTLSYETTDQFPQVYATSRLVAHMEIVCARMLQPFLTDGQLSVGVRVDVTHSAPTPVNDTVTVKATYTGKEGKLFVFDVEASDSGGKIGKAKHERAIVDTKRLEKAAGKHVEGNL